MNTSIEAWAAQYIRSEDLQEKLAPSAVPNDFAEHTRPLRIDVPGRPPELVVTLRAKKAPKRGAFVDPRRRAEILHRFFHHELQAAELMLWALLAFPETPKAFRRGLVQIAHDEIRHANMYLARVAELGCSVTDFPVRDWFWQRIPACTTPSEFVAVMGMGLEAANLDHAERYELLFRELGDDATATLQSRVHEEEIPHVRFAMHWLERFEGSSAEGAARFSAWSAKLPAPLSPWVMKGTPLARDARRRAGFDDAFLDALEAYRPE